MSMHKSNAEDTMMTAVQPGTYKILELVIGEVLVAVVSSTANSRGERAVGREN